MGKEHRRSVRLKSSLPIRLLLRDNGSGSNLAEPLAGHIDDISVHGVRLTVPHIRIDKYHLFYAFVDNEAQSLLLEIAAADRDSPPIVIPARPVWFDHILSEPTRPFQLGMEFLVDSDDAQIERLGDLLGHHERQDSWWHKLFTA